MWSNLLSTSNNNICSYKKRKNKVILLLGLCIKESKAFLFLCFNDKSNLRSYAYILQPHPYALGDPNGLNPMHLRSVSTRPALKMWFSWDLFTLMMMKYNKVLQSEWLCMQELSWSTNIFNK